MTKIQKIVYYVLLVIVSGLFIMAAVPKLMGIEVAKEGFLIAGLPIWFMYFVGIAEITGAVGLWVKGLSQWAGAGLLIILVGAVIVSIMYTGIISALFPLITAILLSFVMKLDKKRSVVSMM